MKKTVLPILFILSLMACHDKNEPVSAGKGYTPDKIKLESDVMTPEVLWSFGRIGNVNVSPDGNKSRVRSHLFQ